MIATRATVDFMGLLPGRRTTIAAWSWMAGACPIIATKSRREAGFAHPHHRRRRHDRTQADGAAAGRRARCTATRSKNSRCTTSFRFRESPRRTSAPAIANGDQRSRRRRAKPRRLSRERPDIIFHLAGVVSGEAEPNFDKGYHVNLDGMQALLEAIRARPATAIIHSWSSRPRSPSTARRSRRRSRTNSISRRSPPTARRRRSCELPARRLHPPRLPRWRRHPPADHLRAARQAEQGGLRLLLRHHPRAARRRGGGAAGRRHGAHTHASPRAAVGFLIHAAGLTREQLGPRINLAMPGVCCTVAEQIEALRRVAGDKVAARIRREPDELIMRIVAGWPQRFEAQPRARARLRGRELVRRDHPHPYRRRPRRQVCRVALMRFSGPAHSGDAGPALQALPRRRDACRTARRSPPMSPIPAR